MIRNGIDITKCDVRCCDELLVENGFINAVYELWFDVEQYFDIKLFGDCYLNLYTNWFPDGYIGVEVTIDNDTASNVLNIPFELDEEEKIFFRNKMEEYSMKRYNKTLIELLNEEYN